MRVFFIVIIGLFAIYNVGADVTEEDKKICPEPLEIKDILPIVTLQFTRTAGRVFGGLKTEVESYKLPTDTICVILKNNKEDDKTTWTISDGGLDQTFVNFSFTYNRKEGIDYSVEIYTKPKASSTNPPSEPPTKPSTKPSTKEPTKPTTEASTNPDEKLCPNTEDTTGIVPKVTIFTRPARFIGGTKTEEESYDLPKDTICVKVKNNNEGDKSSWAISEGGLDQTLVKIAFTYDRKQGIDYSIEIYSKTESTSPTAKPSTDTPTKPPTTKAPTEKPTNSPTKTTDPPTTTPTEEPTKPTTNKPTKAPATTTTDSGSGSLICNKFSVIILILTISLYF